MPGDGGEGTGELAAMVLLRLATPASLISREHTKGRTPLHVAAYFYRANAARRARRCPGA